MKVGLVQYSPAWEDKKQNMEKLNKLLKGKCSDEEILIFPEMALTGFTMKGNEFAEDIDGESISYFMNLAREYNKHVMAGIIENFDNKIYNTLFHFDNNGLILARYRKIHLFSLSGENENYIEGDEPVITKMGKTTIGLTICYDLRFPELYRQYAKERVDIIVNIASWPVQRVSHWVHLLKARAIENQCFMIGVNRVGNDPTLQYNGCSGVFDPMGKELVIQKETETIISSELNLNLTKRTREELPFLNDMKMI